MTSKKILVITSRYPFPVRGGDKLRIAEIMKHLSKKNKIDLVSIGKKTKKIKFLNKQYLFNNNSLQKIFQIFKSFIKNEPLQIGLFKIPEMKKKIMEISMNYDVIIFHLIRSAYYLPNNYSGKKILEMTDLISKNYLTVYENLNNLNLLKWLYSYEKKKLEKFEQIYSKKFDHVVLVNKKDLKNSKIKKNNIKIIGNGTIIKKNIYINKRIKNNVIFFGNINSLANRNACVDFIDNYLPKIKLVYPNIEFKILGNCSPILKFFFRLKGVTVYSNINNLSDHSKNTLAGICNVNIQSGLQNKILDYTSIGIPVLCNQKSNNFKFLKKKDLLVYENDFSFMTNFHKLMKNKKFVENISKKCFHKTSKYYDWKNILTKYSSII